MCGNLPGIFRSLLSVSLLMAAGVIPVWSQWTDLGLSGRSIGDIKIFGDTIYVGTDNGIYKHPLMSTDTLWQMVGLQGKVIRTLVVKEGGELWAVRNLRNTPDSDVVYKTTDGGASWSKVFTSRVSGSGNPTDDHFDVIDSPPSSRDTFYLIDIGAPAIHRTTSGGSTWAAIYDTAWRYRFIKIDPVHPNHLWFGGEGMIFNAILYESTDYGSTWGRIDLGDVFAGDNACHTLACDYSHPQTWYVPGEGKVIKTTDGGATWTVILQNDFYNFDMALSPVSPDLLYDVGGPYLYRSVDGGADWDTIAIQGIDSTFYEFTDVEVTHSNGVDHLILGGYNGVFRYDNIITDVVQTRRDMPVDYQLEQNYPNPFNPATRITYSLPQEDIVVLKVYDLLGREIATLVNEKKQAGGYSMNWNAASIPSGVYFCRMSAGGFVETKKMLLIR